MATTTAAATSPRRSHGREAGLGMAAMLATPVDGPHHAGAPGKISPVISADQMRERLRALPAAQPLLRRLTEHPGVYVVGGAVRDLLLGGQPYDLDLVVEGDAAAVAHSLGGAIRVHDRFGTSTVTLEGFSYDIARARRETYARPGALPDVAPATLSEDLLRRDFTVNAMAIALDSGSWRAAPGAREDLEERRLRVLHDGSFIDDPTRMLRLARYAGRLGFAIDDHTRALVDEALHAGAIWTVGGSRLGAELRLLSREEDPLASLICLRELGVDRAIHPGLGLRDEALARRALELLPADGRRDRLVLTVAGLGVEAEELSGLLDALAFPAPDRDTIVAAATRAPAVARALSQATAPSQIAAAATGAGPELVALAGALGPAEPARDWLERLRHVSLEIDGTDLLAAGVPAGPAIGRGLRAALAAKLDGRACGHDAELAAALRAARETG
jgi:tRNA nucleotidyltransferase (CCA-adding enzyme)